jgi:hypothetical protein
VPRSSFVSFHYQNDHWRVQRVLQIGAIEGQQVMPAQDWEQVKRKGDRAVQEWIDTQMKYKAAVVVLIGSETASRKFVKYEIQRAWDIRKPLLGIRIHGLEDRVGNTSTFGKNPFDRLPSPDGTGSSAVHIPIYNPAGRNSGAVYADIRANLATWLASGYTRP